MTITCSIVILVLWSVASFFVLRWLTERNKNIALQNEIDELTDKLRQVLPTRR